MKKRKLLSLAAVLCAVFTVGGCGLLGPCEPPDPDPHPHLPILGSLEQTELKVMLDPSLGIANSALPLRITTPIGTDTLHEGQDTSISLLASSRSRLVILLAADGSPIAPALVRPADEEVERITIGPQRIALGFIALHPALQQLSTRDREDVLDEAIAHPSFDFMVAVVRSTLQDSPSSLSDGSAVPELFAGIQAIVEDSIEAVVQRSAGSPKGKRDKTVQSHCGEIQRRPTFSVEPGQSGNAVLVNPRNVFYGVDITGPDAARTIELVAPKGSLISFWPPGLTPPTTECFPLSSGSYDFVATAGADFHSDYPNPSTGEGRARTANTLYGLALALDLCGVPIPLPDKVAELGTEAIVLAGGHQASVPDWLKDLSDLMDSIKNDRAGKVVHDILDYTTKNWGAISTWMWEEIPSMQTADFMRALGGLADTVLVFLDLNDVGPFIVDTVRVFGEGPLHYCMTSTGGSISTTCRPEFVADPNFTWSPATGTVGEAMSFDPAGTEVTGTASATFEWIFDDYDGDNSSVDRQTSGKQVVSHTFAQPGLHMVTLQVASNGSSTSVYRMVPVSELPNLGFEAGTSEFWTVETHRWSDATPGSEVSHSEIVGPGGDPIAGSALTMVWSGQHALRIENDGSGCYISSASRSFVVPSQGMILKFAWATVLEDPGHPPEFQPYFDIKVRNEDTGEDIYYIHHYSGEPGFPWNQAASGNWNYTPWQPVELSLKDYGGQTITVSAIGADCGYCGHGGYVYLDGFEGQ